MNKNWISRDEKKVLELIDLDQLQMRCQQSISSYTSEGTFVESTLGGYVYLDRGKHVLGVAHLDTVGGSNAFARVEIGGHKIVYSPRLDDRLGAYILLDLLPLLDVHTDVLLTVGEESMSSTAQDFVSKKDYKWAFSFDRRGTDAVLYHYEKDGDKDFVDKIRKAGFKIGIGSYSDIADLELGVMAANFGTGYTGEHTELCSANLADTAYNVSRFVKFFRENHKTRFKYEGKGSYRKSYYGNSYGSYYGKGYTDLGYDDYRYDGYGRTYTYGGGSYSKKDAKRNYYTYGTYDHYCNICQSYFLKDDFDVSQGSCKECAEYLKKYDRKADKSQSAIVTADTQDTEFECPLCKRFVKGKDIDPEEQCCMDCVNYINGYSDDPYYTANHFTVSGFVDDEEMVSCMLCGENVSLDGYNEEADCCQKCFDFVYKGR
jgi:hypothetical protein